MQSAEYRRGRSRSRSRRWSRRPKRMRWSRRIARRCSTGRRLLLANRAVQVSGGGGVVHVMFGCANVQAAEGLVGTTVVRRCRLRRDMLACDEAMPAGYWQRSSGMFETGQWQCSVEMEWQGRIRPGWLRAATTRMQDSNSTRYTRTSHPTRTPTTYHRPLPHYCSTPLCARFNQARGQPSLK